MFESVRTVENLEKVYLLSNRERQCLTLLLQGNTAKDTAQHLGLSPRTVEFYFENIKNKLNCWKKKDLFKAALILENVGLLKHF